MLHKLPAKMSGTDSRMRMSAYELGSYFPSIPPATPERCLSFPRAIADAPRYALSGVLIYDDEAEKHPVSARHRERHHVGHTNRWRIPHTLLSDCLGTTQAIKSLDPTNIPYHKTMVNILTAENPKHSINVDINVPYDVRLRGPGSGRYSTPAAADMPLSPTFRSSDTNGAVIPRTDKFKFTYSRPTTLNACVPTTVHFTRPTDILHYHSKHITSNDPDILLDCMGVSWKLHWPFLKHSKMLSQLLERAENPKSKKKYKNKMSQRLDQFIASSDIYSEEYREMSQKLSFADSGDDKTDNRSVSGSSQNPKSEVNFLTLKIEDSSVNRKGLAIALGHLYRENTEVHKQDVVAVMVAANALKFDRLVNDCADIMSKTMGPATVCQYYKVAGRCKQDQVITSCKRWLELNLIPQLSAQIYLRDLPMELLEKVLKSTRFFTYSEYWVYRTVAYWVFLQLNPAVQLMPSYSTILTYFNSLNKSTALIETEEGRSFAPLLAALRLHGITDSANIQDMQTMNIIPQSWIVKLLSQHYHSLHGGGDMSFMTNFSTGSIRRGFILSEEPHFHSEILELHGFNFELKAVRRDGAYFFSIKRISPCDPVLSFKQCERQAFSIRQNRKVCFSIKVQFVDENNQYQVVSSGMLVEILGVGSKSNKSKALSLEGLKPPIYVMYSILLPPS